MTDDGRERETTTKLTVRIAAVRSCSLAVTRSVACMRGSPKRDLSESSHCDDRGERGKGLELHGK